MRFVDVTNDIAFRKIFGNENKKVSLISFLNAVINFPEGKKVIEVDIVNPYQLAKLASGKSTIIDVKAKDNNGNTFIVEAINQSDKNVYVQKALLNGKPLDRRYITHAEIMNGGKLSFYMSDKPKK